MKWRVTFAQEQRNCCPPGKYWIVRTQTVEADSQDQAVQEIENAWRYNHKIMIKRVEEYKDEKQGK